MGQRILPERVRQAYLRTGLRPSRVFWRNPATNEAMGFAALVEDRAGTLDYVDKPDSYLATVMRVNDAYVRGFDDGWINGNPPNARPPKGADAVALAAPTRWEERLIGWWDGATAAEYLGLPSYLEELKRHAR